MSPLFCNFAAVFKKPTTIAKLPMLEPSDSAEALQFAKDAFEISEKYDTPVLLRMCTRVSHSQSIAETGERAPREKIPYEKRPSKYIMMPGYAKLRHPIVEERTKKLEELAENCPYNRIEWGGRQTGIITSGTSWEKIEKNEKLINKSFNDYFNFDNISDDVISKEITYNPSLKDSIEDLISFAVGSILGLHRVAEEWNTHEIPEYLLISDVEMPDEIVEYD